MYSSKKTVCSNLEYRVLSRQKLKRKGKAHKSKNIFAY